MEDNREENISVGGNINQNNDFPRREVVYQTNTEQDGIEEVSNFQENGERKHKRNIHHYGVGEQSSASVEVDDIEYYDDEEQTDETEGLLSRDRRGFDVSGHHLSAANQKTSSLQTLIHLIKGNLGTGILAMPDAIRNSGLLTGCLLLPILSIICVHCMHLLVWSSSELQRRMLLKNIDYARVAEAAFSNGPLSLRKLSTVAYYAVSFFLIATQIGFCCVYIVFMSANIKELVVQYFPSMSDDVHIYILIIAVPVLMISMIKSLRSLYYPSLFSNGCIIIGLGCLFFYLLQDLPSVYDRTQFTSFKSLPLFLATSIYAFEGIGVVLPLHRNMKNPEDLGGSNGVLNTAMALVTCLYFGVGFYGYLKYGDTVQGSITLSLPQSASLAQFINSSFVVAIFLTYALMLYVPVELTWPYFVERFSHISDKRWCIYIYRSFLVLLSIGAAALIPHIGLFISLVGAVASSTLALIFPPLIHSIVFYQTQSRLVLTKNILISVFGIFCFITGTFTSVQSIIEELGN